MIFDAADAAQVVASVDGDYNDDLEAHMGAVITHACNTDAVVRMSLRDGEGADTDFIIRIERNDP